MLNRAQIIGRLGRDPESRYLPNGTLTVTLSLATTEKWKDKATGEAKEHTEWHRCIVWASLAEIAAQYLKKGGLVYVEGSLRTRKWTDKDGVERYSTEIRVEQLRMLSGRQDDTGNAPTPTAPANAGAPTRAPSKLDDFEDDIPF